MVIVQRNVQLKEKTAEYSSFLKKNINKFEKKYGAAVDIGTTTIVVSAFEMNSGNLIESKSETNKQVSYGRDVMMRIMHANMGKADLLHNMIISQLEQLLSEICRNNNITDLSEIVVVGNTTMCHLFLNKSVAGLAGAPFKASYDGRVICFGHELGMKFFGTAKIEVLPIIVAHVGADAAAFIMQEKLYMPDKIQLGIDLGTNAEIILNNKGKVWVCSAAAGTAFEGYGIKCGKRAGNGIIKSVKLSKANGNIILGVISESEKLTCDIITGICGSGLIDIIAELLRVGIVQKDGYILSRKEAEAKNIHFELSARLNSDKEGNYFVLCAADNKKGQKEIVITQSDIRNIQLAKAAIQAGAECLMEVNNITLKDMDDIIIGGVFGRFVRESSAIKFGLFPKADNSNLRLCGNAAGNGAAHALLDKSFSNSFENIISKINHLELADKNIFQQKFMNAMELKSWYYGNDMS